MLEIRTDDTWKVNRRMDYLLNNNESHLSIYLSFHGHVYRRREHFQWNMDVWGVAGVEAEAELLAAITTFFKRVGLTSKDVGQYIWIERSCCVVLSCRHLTEVWCPSISRTGIKVNSRGVLGEVLAALGVPESKFAATCVLVDKLEKVRSIDSTPVDH